MQKKPNMGVWSFSERNSGGGQRRLGSLVDREAGKGLAFKHDREGGFFFLFFVFFILAFLSCLVPPQTEPGEQWGCLRQAALFLRRGREFAQWLLISQNPTYPR